MSEFHGDGKDGFQAWRSYPKIWTLGHKLVADIFKNEVIVEEKIDGSQFSFGINESGELMCRSKGATINMLAPEPMFDLGVAIAKQKAESGVLVKGWLYRGEYLKSKAHNTLCYDRTPKDNFIGFDICTGVETYLTAEEKQKEFERIGFETVPVLYKGKVDSAQKIREFLDLTSVLGGQKIEGVVIKSASLFGIDGKPLMAKFVSEAFKEVHQGEWKEKNSSSADFVEQLGQSVKTAQRWQKARMRLAELGKLENSPRDIPLLMAEVKKDIAEEETENLKDAFWKYAKDRILRISVISLPEWYKEQLLKSQFEQQ